jgi:hypothetical protein
MKRLTEQGGPCDLGTWWHPRGAAAAGFDQPPENSKVRENDGGHLDFRLKSDVFYAGQFFVANGDFFSL